MIAPPGNPIIRLDARLLDRVELIGRSPTAPLDRVGRRDRRRRRRGAVGRCPAACSRAPASRTSRTSGSARRAVARAAAICCSRSAISRSRSTSPTGPRPRRASPSSSRRTRATRRSRGPRSTRMPSAGCARRPRARARRSRAASSSTRCSSARDVVYLRGDYLQVGQVAFRIAEVREYALRGANLPLTGGRLLQAAMGLLVVAAEERAPPARTCRARSGSPTTRRGAGTPPGADCLVGETIKDFKSPPCSAGVEWARSTSPPSSS